MDESFREPTGFPRNYTANAQISEIIDTIGFRSLVVHLFATAANMTLTYEQSNDKVNWAPLLGMRIDVAPTAASFVAGTDAPTTTANWVRIFPCHARYVRMRTSAWTSGTLTVTPILRGQDVEFYMANVPVIAGPTQPVSGTVTTNTGLGTGAPGNTVSRIRAAAAANQDAVLIKASAGNVSDIVLVNQSAAARFVKFYNLATSPTSAGTPLFTVPLRAGQEIVLNFSTPLRFGTGIGYRITTGVADADTGAATAEDVHGLISWA